MLPETLCEFSATKKSIAILGGASGQGATFLTQNLNAIATKKETQILDCQSGYESAAEIAQREYQRVTLVTHSDSQSIVYTYSLIKTLVAGSFAGQLFVVINRSNPQEAREVAQRLMNATQHFLGRDLLYLGHLPFDRRATQPQNARPIAQRFPRAPLSLALRRIATNLGLAQSSRSTNSDAWSRVAALFL